MFLGWPIRFSQAMLIGRKTRRPGTGAVLPYMTSENFKNLLLQKYLAYFQIIVYKCSLGDPLLDSLKPWSKNMAARGRGCFALIVDWSKNMAARGWGCFALYGYNENLKNLLHQFKNKFVGMFLGWPYIRLLQAMLIGRKTWPPRREGLLLVI